MDEKKTPAAQGSAAAGDRAPKVSVIIPLYYAEAYIDDLLTQLREQPLKDIEVICVVDGSPDATLDAVKRHAEEDPRIQWLYQENAGAGAARNAGLGLARGDYLAFLDADDLYDPQFLTTMYETAENHDADLVVCQIEHVDCKTGATKSNNGFRLDRVPIGQAFTAEDLEYPLTSLSQVPQNKLCRRAMAEREEVRFSETRVSNDVRFSLCSVVASNRIVAIADSLVTVRRFVNPQSISSNRALHTDDMFVSSKEVRDWLCARGLFERYAKEYQTVWANGFRYNARYDRNERFIAEAARTLGEEEPWCGLTDQELAEAAHLDTSVLGLKRAIAPHLSSKNNRDLELQRIDNKLSAIREVVYLLNAEYGRNIPVRGNTLGGVLTRLRRNGLRHYVDKLGRKQGDL